MKGTVTERKLLHIEEIDAKALSGKKIFGLIRITVSLCEQSGQCGRSVAGQHKDKP